MLASFVLIYLAAVAHGIRQSRVIGGEDASIGAFPYMVSLRSPKSFICAGSIINSRTILTSAKCIESYAKNITSLTSLTIHAGTDKLNTEGTVREATQAIVHEEFDPIKLINDIGLLILSTPLEFTSNIQPIKLAISESQSESGTACVFSGWGKTSISSPFSNELQQMSTTIFDMKDCQKTQSVQSSNICIRSTANSLCYGDAGGALIAQDVQIGIASYHSLQCTNDEPDVFTKVFSFLSWVKEHSKN